jgi:hypothetical protein
MRQDIGPQYYEEAKRQLPEIVRAIGTTYLPFVDRVNVIAKTATRPLRDDIQRSLSRLQEMGAQGPEQLRQGIEAYEELSFQQVLYKDGRSVDINKRAEIVAGIRQALRTYDGWLSAMKREMSQVEQYITDSRWPA